MTTATAEPKPLDGQRKAGVRKKKGAPRKKKLKKDFPAGVQAKKKQAVPSSLSKDKKQPRHGSSAPATQSGQSPSILISPSLEISPSPVVSDSAARTIEPPTTSLQRDVCVPQTQPGAYSYPGINSRRRPMDNQNDDDDDGESTNFFGSVAEPPPDSSSHAEPVAEIDEFEEEGLAEAAAVPPSDGILLQATLVIEEEGQVLSTSLLESAADNNSSSRKRRICCILAAVAILGASVVTPTLFLVNGGGGNVAGSSSPNSTNSGTEFDGNGTGPHPDLSDDKFFTPPPFTKFEPTVAPVPSDIFGAETTIHNNERLSVFLVEWGYYLGDCLFAQRRQIRGSPAQLDLACSGNAEIGFAGSRQSSGSNSAKGVLCSKSGHSTMTCAWPEGAQTVDTFAPVYDAVLMVVCASDEQVAPQASLTLTALVPEFLGRSCGRNDPQIDELVGEGIVGVALGHVCFASSSSSSAAEFDFLWHNDASNNNNDHCTQGQVWSPNNPPLSACVKPGRCQDSLRCDVLSGPVQSLVQMNEEVCALHKHDDGVSGESLFALDDAVVNSIWTEVERVGFVTEAFAETIHQAFSSFGTSVPP